MASDRLKCCTSSSRIGRASRAPGSSGQLVPGYDARIVDEDGAAVPPGETGNLLIRGDSTCAYYWNRHEKTKETIDGHWIRTGDHYRQDEDGFFWFAGRSDDMLKVGGLWVSPSSWNRRSSSTRRERLRSCRRADRTV